MVIEDLSPIEKEVYQYIEKAGEVITTQIPSKKAGAIPRLVQLGRLEVFKKSVSPVTAKKAKFVRVLKKVETE